jgi:hypothetical protein
VIKTTTRRRWLAHLVGYSKDPRKSGLAMSSGSPRVKSTGHGAFPNTAMTHIAIAETLDGKAVDWLEKVSDVEYGA